MYGIGYFRTYYLIIEIRGIMKVLGTIFGLLGGFVIGTLFSKSVVIGGVGAVIGGIIMGKIGGSFGEKAVEAEAKSLSGEKRSIVGAVFWWFVLFAIGASALILIGVMGG